MTLPDPEIEFMSDLPGTALAAELHAECFDTPWSEADFASLFGIRGTVFQLLNLDGEPAAFAVYRMLAGQAEILTFAVRPAFRRQGLGGRLLDSGLEYLKRHDILQLYLEVGDSNKSARQLYESRGFNHHGLRKGYYGQGETAEDAIVMKRLL